MLSWFLISVVALLVGSFAGCEIYRYSYIEQKITSQRSVCPQCQSVLKFLDLIPLFSWLALRGKCRYCFKQIPSLYFTVEFISLLGFWLIFSWQQLFWLQLILAYIFTILLIISVIDLKSSFIYDKHLIWLALGVLSLVFVEYRFNGDAWLWYLFRAGATSFSFWLVGYLCSKILKKASLGFGDVKLVFLLVLPLQAKFLTWWCLLSGLFGIVFALIWRYVFRSEVFPFAPSLILASVICFYWQSIIL